MLSSLTPVNAFQKNNNRKQPETASRHLELNTVFGWAHEAEYKVERVAKKLDVSPKHFWQYCATHYHSAPKALIDLARASKFINLIQEQSEVKCVMLKKLLGFKSESTFHAFAYRVFHCSPEQVKLNPKLATEILVKKINEILDKLPKSDDESRREERENDRRKPKEKTERENRKRKPKEKTENDFP
ncbi:MAG: helix-turn-helix domain-containing protein [Chloroherpetonaceae bacterium]|nr:helix-turn-helix domain-containing protein [Chloroherpetonaceae bacterium]